MKADWNELTMQEKKAGMYLVHVTAYDGDEDRGGENRDSAAWRKLAAEARDPLFAPTPRSAPNIGKRVTPGDSVMRCADGIW